MCSLLHTSVSLSRINTLKLAMVRKRPPVRLLGALGRIQNISTREGSLFRCFANLPNSSRLDYSAPLLDEPADTEVASVALVGAPNAGKSSLSNALIRNRVSAVSRKVNTTRSRIVGACTVDKKQLVFWDTPGVVEQQFVKNLGQERRELTTAGWGAAADADVAVMIVDASRGLQYWKKCAAIAGQLGIVRREMHGGNDAENMEEQRKGGIGRAGLLLVLNKCDITRPRTRLLEATEFFQSSIEDYEYCFDEKVYMVSAYNGRGVDDLRDVLLERTQPGHFEVPDGITHGDDDLELIRQHVWEKLLHSIHQEIPYRCKFENEQLLELPNGDMYVSEIIRVPHRRNVPIVIGPGGQLINWIRDKAMESASIALGRKIHLKLRVLAA